ncbi:unnamed protein product [Parajaminaea phylloscopi]
MMRSACRRPQIVSAVVCWSPGSNRWDVANGNGGWECDAAGRSGWGDGWPLRASPRWDRHVRAGTDRLSVTRGRQTKWRETESAQRSDKKVEKRRRKTAGQITSAGQEPQRRRPCSVISRIDDGVLAFPRTTLDIAAMNTNTLLKRATATLAQARIAPTAARPFARIASAALAQRTFTTTPLRAGSGTSDVELSSRLNQELTYERETAQSQTHGSESEPDFLRDFKSTGTWSIRDFAGSDEIALEREFGNEKIRVLFSIGDIDAGMEEDGFDDDDAAGPNGSSANSEGGEDDEPALPVRCAITITKPNGALTIDAQSEHGQFRIENISFYKDANLASELTAEADWKRRGLYIGPQFPTLDDSLQEQFQAFLEERGIDDDLALFVPMFAEYKEQKEYCNWLENVKSWVEA